MDEECDRCGAKFPPHEIGQNHDYTTLCVRCADLMREKYQALPMPSVDLVTAPDHIVTGPPADDEEDDDDDSELTPLEDRSDWPSHEPDMGEPVGGYDDARNLNAAEITAEIRRMA